ncbi:glycosyl hydrolase family 18 protein [Paucibacter sp. APW11]|uniref:Glycosyl hydrolase family 18 protein n=1 Tax=Roseateles aquae TaxID=3077235 RepID=A0ABU3P6P2_9BURK|nr:glycosyl hydrolase family 18 protein [Paucibacter sp. APW11]MDT8998234.1 glycosyl hydrolase family 18 protein [Paucibacter sp. APW11]
MRTRLVYALALTASAGPALAYNCTNVAPWNASTAYNGSAIVKDNNVAYQAKWWTQNEVPATHSGQWDVWKNLGNCDGSVNQPPVASFTNSASGLTVSVNGSASSDPDGSIASYAWNFGDNSTASGATASHAYAAAGTYTITLTVTDNKGATNSKTASVTVSGTAVNKPPVASFTSSASGLTLSVNGSGSSDPDGTIASYAWNFGDNTSGSGVSTSHAYVAAGTYTVTLTVTDNKGATNAKSTSVTVSSTSTNKPPTVTLTAPGNNSTANDGDVLTLSASASDPDGSVAKVSFYDNGALIADDASNPYSVSWTAKAGVHDLSARATDDKGATSDLATARVTVNGGVAGDEKCRPEGLYTTPGTTPAYCKVYDANGRELMGADKPRRIIGYFTSWRTGKDGTPAYLASQIPWDKLTHINYAFAHVDGSNKLSIGNTADPNNAATGLTWAGVAGAEMDAGFAYKGHFNLLNKFKKQYPNVKTLISVGGWAETGGYFDDSGKRVASGGFYTMTTNADGSANTAGINTFADSAVAFIRQYGFNGVDIDYEYATSMKDAGNPDDFTISNARRASLMKNFVTLMQTLRAKLDAAGQADSKHYMLTVAAPASGYLLRGMETYQVTQYLDYVNMMSYDLHGAWNQFVGPNAALNDKGDDSELVAWSYYTASQYGRIGYLNTDWAYHYFRGALPAGRINIGVPYYTRGWKDVTGGSNGLWGTAAQTDQSKCPPGTGGGTVQKCGAGAIGLDNIWHDLDVSSKEVPAGSNPLWHTMNLAAGKSGSYIGAYGLNPATNPQDQFVGSYTRYYDSTLVAPWLWNAQKKVFLSIEDEQSLGAKAQWVSDRGIGGVMFWELAGDYAYDNSKAEYGMGSTLTNLLYNKFKTAAPYGNRLAQNSTATIPSDTIDIRFAISGFALGDANYPINPTLTVTNKSTQTLPGGTDFSFDIPTAIPASLTDQSGFGLKVVTDGSNPGGGNVGGLKNDFHRAAFKLPSWQTLAPGASVAIKLNYYLPMPTPSNWVVSFGGKSYALTQENRRTTTTSLAATSSANRARASSVSKAQH